MMTSGRLRKLKLVDFKADIVRYKARQVCLSRRGTSIVVTIVGK